MPRLAGRASACRREPLLRRRTARRRAPASTVGLQPQVHEDLLDHRLLQDDRNNLYSSYVAAKTRLSSFVQLSRTGRWCAQFASQSAGGTVCAGASASCGTTSARNLAFGASTPWFAQRGFAHFAQRSHADTKRIRCSLGLGTSAASRCMNSSGDITRWVVPSRQGGLQLQYDLPGGVGLYAFFCPELGA